MAARGGAQGFKRATGAAAAASARGKRGGPRTKSLQPQNVSGMDMLAGPHAVAAALLSGSRWEARTLFLQNDLDAHFPQANLDEVLAIGREKYPKLRVRRVDKRSLVSIARNCDLRTGPVCAWLETRHPRLRGGTGQLTWAILKGYARRDASSRCGTRVRPAST